MMVAGTTIVTELKKKGSIPLQVPPTQNVLQAERPVVERKAVRQADQAVAVDVLKIAKGVEDHDGKRQQVIEREQRRAAT